MALANLVAVGGAAHNIVLLGDPQQLPQPTKGTHPGGAGHSALEHILDGHATIPPERGLLLDVTWRMHPDVCGFVSDASYEAACRALTPAPATASPPGSGSAEPACGGSPSNTTATRSPPPKKPPRSPPASPPSSAGAGSTRTATTEPSASTTSSSSPPTTPTSPNCEAALPAGARVGTVDKFQGQEAAVVIFSMATSSADDMPRDLEFLFSLNRLNVAISRARALAVLVCSPELLRVRCRTPEQMRLVNALCLLVEHARTRTTVFEPEVAAVR